MIRAGVTTIPKMPPWEEEKAQARAEALMLPFVPRKGNLPNTAAAAGADGLLVYGKKAPFFWTRDGEYRYHIGTAALRIEQMRRGGEDRLCSLLPEGKNLTILDATFGMGSDSAVLSWYLGEAGHVTALEKSPILWEIGHLGLASFEDSRNDVTAALRRVELLRKDFTSFLKHLPPRSYDVIYMDPMFRCPVKGSSNMEAFRRAASMGRVSPDQLESACRAAARCVILKERPFSQLFRSFPFSEVHNKKGQTTAYGVVRW